MVSKNHTFHIYTERPHLRNPALTVLMKLSVDGHFDEPRFEKALQMLKHIHPLLYSSIFIDNDREAYYQQNAVIQLELHCIKREHQNHWLKTAEAENKRPFNCEHGPLIRFFVFYSETDFDILAVVHHLLGDGDAIARLLRDVVAAYTGIDLAPQDQKLISSQNDFPHNATPPFLVKMFTRSLNTMWNKGKQPRFKEPEYQEMFNNYHQSADIGLSYSTINAIEMNNIYRACKAHGITITEAIATAFILAMREKLSCSNNNKIVIGIPINIRKQLTFSADACLGNFASAITITEKYDAKKDFWRNALRVRKKMNLKMKSVKSQWLILNLYALMNPLLIDAMYFAAYGKCDDKAAKKAASMLSIDKASSTAISNLGRLNFDSQIGSYRIRDMVFFAPKAPGSYAVLGVATLENILQIGISYDRNIISSVIMEDISSQMVAVLKNHCS